MPRTVRFDMNSGRTHDDAVALIYDLEGFSNFVNQPDAQSYVPRFFNHVSKAIEVVIYGGVPYWLEEDETYDPLPEPVHQKFLGDGALYIWVFRRKLTMRSGFALTLLNRLRDLSANFAAVEHSSLERVPVVQRPKKIRFGIAAGRVNELRRNDVTVGVREYAGICINLASRLQNYCPGVTLVASAKVGITEFQRKRNNYVRVLARKIKGFSPEPVLVDREEYGLLKPKLRTRHFAPE